MNPSRLQAHEPSAGSERSHYTATEEGRIFFQERLAILGQLFLSLTLIFYVAAMVYYKVAGGEYPSPIVFSLMAASALVWLACRRGAYTTPTLKTLDAVYLLAFALIVAIHGWLHGWSRENDLFRTHLMLMPITLVVVGRAVLIPSTGLRTCVLSTLAYVPAFVVAYLDWAHPDIQIPVEKPPYVLYVVRGLIGVVMATVVSRVIYGLRRQVRKAMQLGQYHLDEKIGQGGMGEVYKASHAMLRRPTAIKLLRPEMAGERSIARFEQEVQHTSQLTHPNTVAIYDYGRTPDGVFYYAMEFLPGLDLDDLVEIYGPLPPERAIYILRQVCGSLAEAHAIQLIHRDIKPANIILCGRGLLYDVVKVVDFGLVKDMQAGPSAALSSINAVTGTPLYMSPESISAPVDMDGRSDLYAVGAVGYFLLTGHNVFESDNIVELCSHHLMKTPEKPSTRTDNPLPEDLENLIMACLEKDREKRPQSAAKLEVALAACVSDGRWDNDRARSWWEKHETSPREPTIDRDANTVVDPTTTRVSFGAVTVDVDERLSE